jgi:ketose-bisphosphate aldolase
MIVNGKELTKKAREEGYGIGAFNIRDYVGIETILRAGEELGTPLMIQVGDFADPNAQESRRMSTFEAKNLMKFLCQRAEASPIPVVIHLDHCPTYEGCIRAIQNGATSVMIDASMKSFEENVAMTNKVIEAAHACNVMVEAEIGHVSGHANSTGVQYTSVEGAKAFYDATHVDMLAVSIGTVHGVYTTEPQLQYDLIKQLRDAIPCPLVMHGSSGLVADQYRNAVKNGIVKINFATYLQLVFGAEMREAAIAAGDKAMFSALISTGMKRGVDYVKEHIGYFGTKKA